MDNSFLHFDPNLGEINFKMHISKIHLKFGNYRFLFFILQECPSPYLLFSYVTLNCDNFFNLS